MVLGFALLTAASAAAGCSRAWTTTRRSAGTAASVRPESPTGPPRSGGGTPDMGNLNADGTQMWLSARYSRVVHVLSTKDGSLIERIPPGVAVRSSITTSLVLAYP